MFFLNLVCTAQSGTLMFKLKISLMQIVTTSEDEFYSVILHKVIYFLRLFFSLFLISNRRFLEARKNYFISKKNSSGYYACSLTASSTKRANLTWSPLEICTAVIHDMITRDLECPWQAQSSKIQSTLSANQKRDSEQHIPSKRL